MSKSDTADERRAPIDNLMARPDETPLPTTLDPSGPQAHGYPADPKPVAKKGQGDPDAKDPSPDDIGRSA